MLVRDIGGGALAGRSPSAQLLVKEAAEDVTPLSHRAANALQEEIPAAHRRRGEGPLQVTSSYYNL